MTSRVSSCDFARAALMQTAEYITKINKDCDALIHMRESQRNKQAPLSKNPDLQATVNETYAIYQKSIETSIVNLKALKATTEEVQALAAHPDLSALEVSRPLEQILSRYYPLVNQTSLHETDVKKLENRIVELTS